MRTHQHPRRGQALPTGLSTTSMQLNAGLLPKKLKSKAPQGLIQTQTELMRLSHFHPLPLPVIVRDFSSFVLFV